LPCGGVGLPQGLYRSAFALTINHECYLIYCSVVGLSQRRVLKFDAGAIPRVVHDARSLSTILFKQRSIKVVVHSSDTFF